MTIKQLGGIFGRNPTFEDVTIEGTLTFDGDIDVNSDLKVAGDIETTGNVIIATSGKGIDFSATAGAGTSELLNDYEEGTFSPTYTTSGTDFDSVSYVVVYGNYVKIGTLVYATGFIRTSSITVGSASGVVRIGGLPFARTGSMSPPVYISGAEGWAGDVPIGGLVNTDQTITLQYRTAANTDYLNTAITDLTTSGSNDIRFTAMYRVSY